MVDLTKFLIINQSQFDDIITKLNLTLINTDETYLLTYILTNIFAYLVIIIFLFIVKFMYYQLFSRKKLIVK